MLACPDYDNRNVKEKKFDTFSVLFVYRPQLF
jgi:hypothetical protein